MNLIRRPSRCHRVHYAQSALKEYIKYLMQVMTSCFFHFNLFVLCKSISSLPFTLNIIIIIMEILCYFVKKHLERNIIPSPKTGNNFLWFSLVF